ncbi:hypothetical protein ODR19_17665, partial [Escherichia coli]|nr:hypothetical protein [Escherichia coli]
MPQPIFTIYRWFYLHIIGECKTLFLPAINFLITWYYERILLRTRSNIPYHQNSSSLPKKNVHKIIHGKLPGGFAPIFPDICYHLTHYKPAAADIPVASDNPAHY